MSDISEQTCPFQLRRPDQTLEAVLGSASGSELPGYESRTDRILGPREASVYAALRFRRRKESYLLGRCAAKMALGRFLRLEDFRALEIYPGVFDQPLVRVPPPGEAAISLTHCDGLALALAHPPSHPMGLDLERPATARAAAIESHLCPAERALGRELPLSDLARLTLLWTIKEALSKVLRCGLMASSEALAVKSVAAGDEGIWSGLFAHFWQYKSVSWVWERLVVTMVLPKKSQFEAGETIRRFLARHT